MEALVASVLLITQLVKTWIKTWFKLQKLASWSIVALSFIVSCGVVIYTYSQAGTSLDLNALWTAFAVFALANGGKKLLSTLKPK